ncbi:Gfo/Idh/MocA family oxidoreductase [Streptomyces sp. NPDC007084]|uniref:Gfo/Idh/MocA family protein n=1 Tax=Streptomyces sp. NPDC007084 TaxID=3154313 RepID=UPI003456E06D
MERVVLIGAGGFGECWREPLESVSDQLTVIGIVDPDPEARSGGRRHYGLGPDAAVAELEDELSAWKPTIVIDSSPFPHRSGNVGKAFAAGADVLAAKPLGVSLEQARHMVTAAASARRELVVAQQMRYFPCFLALRDLITGGRLGRLRAVRIRMALDGRGWEPGTHWRLGLEQPLLHEAGIHHFDLMRWVLSSELTLGSLVSWNPPWSPFTGDATVTGLLRTAENVPVVYEATFAPAEDAEGVRFDSGWEIVTDQATVRVDNGGLFLDGRPVEGVAVQDEPVPLEVLNTSLLHTWLTCRQQGTSPPFTGEDNLRSMALLDRALELAGAGT